MAAAMGAGMRSMRRPKGLTAPARTTSAPARRKAPTAARREMPLVAAISAAPGVDQAVTTGMR